MKNTAIFNMGINSSNVGMNIYGTISKPIKNNHNRRKVKEGQIDIDLRSCKTSKRR